MARVFRNSPIEVAMHTGQCLAPGKYVIGDSAYPLSTYIMVPFRDNSHLNAAQKKYKKTLSSQRQAVDRTFGLTKGRFRQLRNLESSDVRHVCQLITAACVLHNVCVMADDDASEYLEMDADYNQRPNNYPAVFLTAKWWNNATQQPCSTFTISLVLYGLTPYVVNSQKVPAIYTVHNCIAQINGW